MAEEQIKELVERKYREEFEKKELSPDLLAKVIAEYESILQDDLQTSDFEDLERVMRLFSAQVDYNFKKGRTTVDDLYLAGYAKCARDMLEIIKREKEKLRAPFGVYL